MQYPKVTIGVPIFNGASTIHRLLDSLVSQDYPNIEIVISDNCSTDNSAEVCLSYVKRFSFVSLIQQPENTGLYRNSYFVTEQGIGKYFMWAHHDDWFDQNWISEMVKALEKRPQLSSAIGPTRVYDSGGASRYEISFAGALGPARLGRFGMLAMLLWSPLPFIGNTSHGIFVHALHRKAIIDGIFAPVEGKKLSTFDNREWKVAPLSDRGIVSLLLLRGNVLYLQQPQVYFHKQNHIRPLSQNIETNPPASLPRIQKRRTGTGPSATDHFRNIALILWRSEYFRSYEKLIGIGFCLPPIFRNYASTLLQRIASK